MNEWNLCGSHAQTRSTQKKWQKKDLSMIMSAVFDCLTLPFICDSFFHSPQNKTKKSSKARNLIPTKRKKKLELHNSIPENLLILMDTDMALNTIDDHWWWARPTNNPSRLAFPMNLWQQQQQKINIYPTTHTHTQMTNFPR